MQKRERVRYKVFKWEENVAPMCAGWGKRCPRGLERKGITQEYVNRKNKQHVKSIHPNFPPLPPLAVVK